MRPRYAGIGARDLHPQAAGARLAWRLAERLAAARYVLRSGGSAGADSAFELGVARAVDKEIYRPNAAGQAGDGRLPPGHRSVRGEPEQRARAIAAALTEAFAQLDELDRALHVRNVFQIFGAALDRPAEFVLALPPDDPAVRGTRMTMRVAELAGVPVYDLGAIEQRDRFLERLRALERSAGIVDEGPLLRPPSPPLRARFAVGGERLPGRRIQLHVEHIARVPSLGECERSAAVYVGRSTGRAARLGLTAVALANPYVLGRHGSRWLCVLKYAFDIAAAIARADAHAAAALAVLGRLAAQRRELVLVCHCAPAACHADAIAVAVGERLAEIGASVEYAIPPERLEPLLPPMAGR